MLPVVCNNASFARPIGRALIEASNCAIRPGARPSFARPIGRALIEAFRCRTAPRSPRTRLHGQLAVPSLKPPSRRRQGGAARWFARPIGRALIEAARPAPRRAGRPSFARPIGRALIEASAVVP